MHCYVLSAQAKSLLSIMQETRFQMLSFSCKSHSSKYRRLPVLTNRVDPSTVKLDTSSLATKKLPGNPNQTDRGRVVRSSAAPTLLWSYFNGSINFPARNARHGHKQRIFSVAGQRKGLFNAARSAYIPEDRRHLKYGRGTPPAGRKPPAARPRGRGPGGLGRRAHRGAGHARPGRSAA